MKKMTKNKCKPLSPWNAWPQNDHYLNTCSVLYRQPVLQQQTKHELVPVVWYTKTVADLDILSSTIPQCIQLSYRRSHTLVFKKYT